ncbi:MAG: class I SAM-dependent methyltransferase [Solirubrobacterales bacterium]
MTEPPPSGSDSISPTAHYTAAVWSRNGLSPPELATGFGRISFNSARPLMAASHALGGPTLEEFLLARHRLIDHLLERAIQDGRVSQVLEIACGMSPRGWRFARDHGNAIDYVEADLPAMASRKREALERADSLGAHHRVVEIDALAASGAHAVGAIAGGLDRSRGLAVITEGLISYLDRDGVLGLWSRIAATLAGFADGFYLSDIHLGGENPGPAAAAFKRALGVFVRGTVELHFDTAEETRAALLECGFASAELHRPLDFSGDIEVSGRGAELVRVIDASP